MILAGDVGGTKTNVALFGGSGDRLTLIRRASYRSREHDGLRPILDEFLGAHHRCELQLALLGCDLKERGGL